MFTQVVLLVSYNTHIILHWRVYNHVYIKTHISRGGCIMPVWQNQRYLQTGNSHLRKIAITAKACTSKKNTWPLLYFIHT